MKVQFKNADLKDLPAIVRTYNSTIPGKLVTADLEPVTVESKLNWFHEHNSSTRPLLILEVEGVYAGWVSFQNFYGRPAYNQTAEVSIYLEESMRGKGLGKICLQKAIDNCSELGISTLLGFIFGHNETSLKLFYQLGFEKWGHLPRVADMEGTMRDLLILGRRVSTD